MVPFLNKSPNSFNVRGPFPHWQYCLFLLLIRCSCMLWISHTVHNVIKYGRCSVGSRPRASLLPQNMKPYERPLLCFSLIQLLWQWWNIHFSKEKELSCIPYSLSYITYKTLVLWTGTLSVPFVWIACGRPTASARKGYFWVHSKSTVWPNFFGFWFTKTNLRWQDFKEYKENSHIFTERQHKVQPKLAGCLVSMS